MPEYVEKNGVFSKFIFSDKSEHLEYPEEKEGVYVIRYFLCILKLNKAFIVGIYASLRNHFREYCIECLEYFEESPESIITPYLSLIRDTVISFVDDVSSLFPLYNHVYYISDIMIKFRFIGPAGYFSIFTTEDDYPPLEITNFMNMKYDCLSLEHAR